MLNDLSLLQSEFIFYSQPWHLLSQISSQVMMGRFWWCCLECKVKSFSKICFWDKPYYVARFSLRQIIFLPASASIECWDCKCAPAHQVWKFFISNRKSGLEGGLRLLLSTLKKMLKKNIQNWVVNNFHYFFFQFTHLNMCSYQTKSSHWKFCCFLCFLPFGEELFLLAGDKKDIRVQIC